jgi:hypothetical protein
MQTAKQAIFAQVAKAKLVYIKKTDSIQVVIAFNVTARDAKGRLKFPVQKKCDFVSGHLPYKTLEKDLERTLATAKQALRTDNIVFVD